MEPIYFRPASGFSARGNHAKLKPEKLPSWRIIALRLEAALVACDWSFGRAQAEEVHERIGAARALVKRKLAVARPRKRGDRRGT